MMIDVTCNKTNFFFFYLKENPNGLDGE